VDIGIAYAITSPALTITGILGSILNWKEDLIASNS